MAERRHRPGATLLAAVLALGSLGLLGCGAEDDAVPPDTRPAASPSAPQKADDVSEQLYPDIVAVDIVAVDDGIYDLDVTVSSPYDTPQRYADGWRVLAPDGTVLGEHQLLHDHASEQPFTRTQRGVSITADVTEVTIEGRDRVNGYGGTSLTVEVPAS